MEPEALKSLMANSAGAQPDALGLATMSIAISLKRIADAIGGVAYDPTPGANNSAHRMGLTDGIMHAIEQGIIVAARGR